MIGVYAVYLYSLILTEKINNIYSDKTTRTLYGIGENKKDILANN